MPPISTTHKFHDDHDVDEKTGIHHHHGRARAPGQPLRRGDACLMCRAKKLKCSAQKPVCDQCAKRKDRCVYDAIRPASRVEKLERKLAEMDEQDFQEAVRRRASKGYGRLSFSSTDGTSTPMATNTIGQDNGIPNFAGYDILGQHVAGRTSLTANGETTSPNSVDQMLQTDPEQLVNIRALPTSAWPWPASSTIQTFPLVNNDIPSGHQHINPLPWTMIGSSSDIGFLGDRGSPTLNGYHGLNMASTNSTPASSSRSQSLDSTASSTPPNFFNNSPPVAGFDNLDLNLLNIQTPLDGLSTPQIVTPFLDGYSLNGLNKGDMLINGHNMDRIDNLSWRTVLPPHGSPVTTSEVIQSVMQVKKEVEQEEKSMRAEDLGQGARDYLLDLFFSPDPPRSECGSELFTQEEFRTKMGLPENEKPHPCLLFSMYTIASSGSYIPSIRRLSQPLFKIAVSKIEIAIRNRDRLIDAINASKNLSKWLFTQARSLEGHQFACKAVSLCIACELHRIPSSVYRSEDYMSLPSKPDRILESPTNQWEVAERIHAFWSAWGNEKGGCLSHGWPSTIRDETIITPLPRPRADYSGDVLVTGPDVTLRDLYDRPHHENPAHLRSLYCYLLASTHLIHRSMDLGSLPPEAALSSYRSLTHFHCTPSTTLRETHPVAYSEIILTSTWLENNIPEEWKLNFLDSPTWKQPDIPIIALCLKTSRMHLHTLYTDPDQTIGLGIAFECSNIIRSLTSYYQKIQPLSSQSTTSHPTPPQLFSSPVTIQITSTNDEPTELSDEGSNSSTVGDNAHPRQACSRTISGLSGPYTLNPSLWVVQKLVDGAKVLEDYGRAAEANKCMIEVQSIIDGYKALTGHGSLVTEHIEKLEKLITSST